MEVDRYQQLADLVGVELRKVLDERQTRSSVHNASASAEISQTVERSVQTIIAAVRDAVNYASSQEPIVDHETKSSNQPADTDSDEDVDLSEEDRIVQLRMREALVQAQTNFNTRIKEEHLQMPIHVPPALRSKPRQVQEIHQAKTGRMVVKDQSVDQRVGVVSIVDGELAYVRLQFGFNSR
ncbi:unnamed protein product [Phytophthora fragariaefolia]|uniref:Unnamed protein product n=1 Tax=Phytophthora fragariaefolia TaxID=1490495 RepID=A0A9W6U0M4_9STRA|nr:unnamed protein product [Phytophthora fragariaefolia]